MTAPLHRACTTHGVSAALWIYAFAAAQVEAEQVASGTSYSARTASGRVERLFVLHFERQLRRLRVDQRGQLVDVLVAIVVKRDVRRQVERCGRQFRWKRPL